MSTTQKITSNDNMLWIKMQQGELKTFLLKRIFEDWLAELIHRSVNISMNRS